MPPVKMMSLLLIVFIAMTSRAESQDETCKWSLSKCLENLPIGASDSLPVSEDQINKLCRTYKLGDECVQVWSKKCLPENKRKAVQLRRQGVSLLMTLLCDDEHFQKGYLNHTSCFRSVSGDWTRCVENLKSVNNEVETTEIKTGSYDSFKKQINLCCASYAFNRCVTMAAKAKCTKDAAVLLRRISETLSLDSSKTARCDTINTIDVCHSTAGTLMFNFILITFCIFALLFYVRI